MPATGFGGSKPVSIIDERWPETESTDIISDCICLSLVYNLIRICAGLFEVGFTGRKM